MKNKIVMSILSILLIEQTGMSAIPLAASAKPIPKATQKAKLAKKADVSTIEELKASLNDPAITDINLTADVELTESLTASGPTKKLHGNNHTINSADNYYIKLIDANATATLENVKIINGDEFGVFFSSANSVKVTYRNVEHTGKRLLELLHGELILEGKITSNITKFEGFNGESLTILPDAEVNLFSTSTSDTSDTPHLAPIRLTTASGFLHIGTNAKLKARSISTNILTNNSCTIVNEGNVDLKSSAYDSIQLAGNNILQNKSGSTLKTVSEGTGEYSAIKMVEGNSLEVDAESTLEAESSGTKATIYTGKSDVSFANHSNFMIENHNASGHIFYSLGSSNISLASTESLKTWENGTSLAEGPSHSYDGPLTATFDLNGSFQSGLDTNDEELKSTFHIQDIEKIVGGNMNRATSEATLELKQPINPTDPHPPIVEPTDPDDGTHQVGDLTLDYVSSFDFGDVELSNKEVEADLVGPKTQSGDIKAMGLQVTDIRGKGAGWKVTAHLSNFEGQTNHHPLKGVQLVLPKGDLVTHNDSNVENAPTANAVNLDADSSDETIFQANAGEGLGSWFDHMDPKKIKLKMPNNIYADTYKAVLTWNLNDAPV